MTDLSGNQGRDFNWRLVKWPIESKWPAQLDRYKNRSGFSTDMVSCYWMTSETKSWASAGDMDHVEQKEYMLRKKKTGCEADNVDVKCQCAWVLTQN